MQYRVRPQPPSYRAPLGLVGALLLPERLHAAVGTAWLVGLVGAGAVGTALLLVINAALLGVRRAELSLLGSVVASLSRLVTVAALLSLGVVAAGADATAAHTILAVWVASLMVSFGLSVRLLARATPGFRFRPGLIWLSRLLRRGVAWEHFATLGAPVTRLRDADSRLSTLPARPSRIPGHGVDGQQRFSSRCPLRYPMHCLADCADRPERLQAQARRALLADRRAPDRPCGDHLPAGLRRCSVCSVPTTPTTARLLVLLLLSTLPTAAVNLAVAILRVQRRLAAAAAVTVTGAAITLGGAWLLMPHLGIIGAAWAALASQVVVATALLAIGYRRIPGGSAHRLQRG